MAAYLYDRVFEEVPRTMEEVSHELSQQLDVLGFVPGKGIPYNYGIWKAKKGKFRFIAGARADPLQPSANPGDQRGGPPRVPTYFMCKALVKVLDHVGSTLKVINEKGSKKQA